MKKSDIGKLKRLEDQVDLFTIFKEKCAGNLTHNDYKNKEQRRYIINQRQNFFKTIGERQTISEDFFVKYQKELELDYPSGEIVAYLIEQKLTMK